MPRPGEEPVEVECTLLARTDSAIRIRAGTRRIWIPLSAVHDDNGFDPDVAAIGDEGTLVIKEWLATKEGLT